MSLSSTPAQIIQISLSPLHQQVKVTQVVLRWSRER